jgi:hypothetical protein
MSLAQKICTYIEQASGLTHDELWRLADLVIWRMPPELPDNLQTILIVYNGQMWPGVYANGRVVRYPEDYPPVALADCTYWCALPKNDRLAGRSRDLF